MMGTIYEINRHRELVAILTSEEVFSIFELLDENPVEKGDQVLWEEDIEKCADLLTNITQNQTYWVYFHKHGVQKHQLGQELHITAGL